MSSVQQMIDSGRIAEVPPDRDAALVRLQRAVQHLETAQSLIGWDNEVAYGSLYDAARKSITAHMLAHGLRATARARAHEAVGQDAAERVPDPSGRVAMFDQLRRRRNRSEYEDAVLGDQDVAADLASARGIVDAVSSDLGAPRGESPSVA